MWVVACSILSKITLQKNKENHANKQETRKLNFH